MFIIGDIIFLPVFGGGYIANIEDKKIHGEICKYYIINFVINRMSIMIPVYSEEAKKIRSAVSREECMDILQLLSGPFEPLPYKWSERHRYYNDSIKEGNIYRLAAILRDITALSRVKKLSKSEVKIFKEILNMAASEICLVLGRDFDDVKKDIMSILNAGKGFLQA